MVDKLKASSPLGHNVTRLVHPQEGDDGETGIGKPADKHQKLLLEIRSSVRYHNRRCFFYGTLEPLVHLTSIIAIIFGLVTGLTWLMTATIPWVLATASILFFLLSIVNIVLKVSARMVEHTNFRRQFIELEKRLKNSNLDENKIADVQGQLLDLRANEPPIYDLLSMICYFDILATNDPSFVYPKVPVWRRAALHFLNQANYANTLRSQKKRLERPENLKKLEEQDKLAGLHRVHGGAAATVELKGQDNEIPDPFPPPSLPPQGKRKKGRGI